MKPKRLNSPSFSKLQLSIFAVVFAALGGYLIWNSHAAPNPNLTGDLNDDNVVNTSDLSILLYYWNTNNSTADINTSGTVDIFDLSILLNHYGQSYSGGGGCTRSINHPYPCNSLWNTALPANPAVNPNSAYMINYFLANGLKSPNLTIHSYSIAVAQTDGSDPTFNINCITYSCDLNDQGPVPIPSGTYPSNDSDGHLTIWDSSRHLEFDIWQSQCPSNCSTAGSGGLFDTNQSGVGKAGSDAIAAGLPDLPGIMRPEDIQRGYADHALIAIINTSAAKTGHVCPATNDDGISSDTYAIPEGTLLQLDPSINVDSLSLPGWEKAVAKTLQMYGMYIVDKGGSFAIYGENPVNFPSDPWASLGLGSGNPLFSSSFPWSSLRVLSPPSAWCP